MKENLHAILNVDNDNTLLSRLYNILNILFTMVSIVPLLFKQQTDTLFNIEIVAVSFFVVDYLLRWFTAEFELPNKSGWKAYISYPFSKYAIIDLLSILPFITYLDQTLRVFRLFRMVRSLRIFRTFRLFRHSKSFELLIRTIKKQQDSLLTVGALTLAYIFIAALLVFNIETDTFPSFLEALLWATSSLTTATYGDMYPTSPIGQVFSMISYLVGVLVIALPSSIITAGYIDELEKDGDMINQENNEEDED
ncbi:MAG TPA: ion transporter [Atopostipes sp.]|nr:ion transporter [Atopostipes sp.]